MTEKPYRRPAFEPAARLLTPVAHNPEMPRPPSIVAGTVLGLLRIVAGVVVLTAIAASWDSLLADAGVLREFELARGAEQAALWFVIASGATIVLADLVVLVFVFRGRNWARVLTMLGSVVSISTSFTAWWVQDQEITLDGALPALALDILLLLALSSRSAAAYARRNER